MTWAEFKQRVEALGVKDGDELQYIDTSHGQYLHVKILQGVVPRTQISTGLYYEADAREDRHV
jgi:hypothetical protein